MNKATNIMITMYNKDDIPHNGNKFLNGNGYFGVRGTLEEYTKENMCAVNMAGIYDRVGDSWRESVNAPNPLYTVLYVDGVKYSVLDVEPESHTQCLDIEKGIHSRKTVFKTAKGSVEINCERFASMANQHLIAMKYCVKASYDCQMEIVTGIDGDVWDINGPHYVKLECLSDSVSGTTGEKNIVVTTAENVISKLNYTNDITDNKSLKHFNIDALADKEYTFTKIVEISTSIDDIIFEKNIKYDIKVLSYDVLYEEHTSAWKKIWEVSKVHIDGDEDAEFALNYSIYHLNCIAPRNLNSISIPARGLSGQVYKGAIFWDTEMFMIDYYLATEPEIVKSILKYRIKTLEGAKVKAKEYGFDGAFYAWESQEDGIDACSEYNVVDVFTKRPMRTYFRDKQLHISSAVVYAFDKYIKLTGDTSILDNGGAEVLVECAKFYCSLLVKKFGKNVYEIHDAVGPDEYHERVNNNAYTNRMAKFTLEIAAKYTDKTEYAEIAKQIYIPQPNDNNIIEQFDGYFKLEDCSVDEVRSRLLDPKEYWGGAYGVASDTKVIKQADVVAMLSMFPEEYSKEVMVDNLKYYEPRTEHGSSLSACMYSLLSCKIGDPDFAYPFFMKSATSDLRSGGKEWAGLIYIGGTHPAAEGGAWKVAVQGFAGMTVENGEIRCNPMLPEKWNKLTFNINYNGKLHKVEVTKDDWSVTQL